MNKTACIFGSTGLIGNYLVGFLQSDERYQKIILFNRTNQEIHHPKIEQIAANYSELNNFKEQLAADEYYCCLGTTIKKAKTKEAFEYVDYQLPVEIGKLAIENNVKSYLIVSSIGASAKSNNFYLRTKGRMEETLKSLNISNLSFFRPSMLLGQRKESRFMESISKPIFVVIGILLFGPLKKYKAIHGKTVARAMIYSANNESGTLLYESDRIAEIGK